MRKAAINRRKHDAQLQRNVILNALINATRKKSKLIELFEPEKDEKTAEEILEERNELFGNEATEIIKTLAKPALS